MRCYKTERDLITKQPHNLSSPLITQGHLLNLDARNSNFSPKIVNDPTYRWATNSCRTNGQNKNNLLNEQRRVIFY
jgi:hypothetical protein